MIRLIFDPDMQSSFLAWIAERMPDKGPPLREPWLALGVFDGNQLIAVFVYHNIADEKCRVSVAADSPRWAQRKIIRQLFEIAFERAEFEKIEAISKRTDRRTNRLLRGLGFFNTDLFPNGYDGDEDAFIWEADRETADRWAAVKEAV